MNRRGDDVTALEMRPGIEVCTGTCTSATAEIVGWLIDGTWSNESHLERSVRNLGIDLNCRWTLVLLTPVGAGSDLDFEVHALGLVAREPFRHFLVGRARAMPTRHIPIVAPAPKENGWADRLFEVALGLSAEDGLLLLPSDRLCEWRDLPGVYSAQVDSIPCARACTDRSGAVVTPADFPVYRMLHALPAATRREFVRSVLGPIFEMSPTKSEQALLTLEAYFRRRGRIEEIAADLDLHRNTFHYRLTRVQDVLGADIRGGVDRLRVELAVMLRRLHEEETIDDPAEPAADGAAPPAFTREEGTIPDSGCCSATGNPRAVRLPSPPG